MSDTITMYQPDDESDLLTEEDAEERYDEMLDDVYGTATIAWFDGYDTSRALKMLDPVAYRQGFLDYIDSWTEHEVPLSDYLAADFEATEWIEAHQ